MDNTRSKFEPWLTDHFQRRSPELAELLIRALEAFDHIQNSKGISSELLAPIVEAASSSSRPIIENVTPFLVTLSRKYVDARDAIELMAKDTKSHVRFNAILCLGKSPRNWTLRLLRQGLRDKSAKVRGKAADWAGNLQFKEIVADLEEVFDQEQNPVAKREIEFNLKLLRDGFILDESEDDSVCITTISARGGIIGSWFTRSELKKRGIDAIVEELAKK